MSSGWYRRLSFRFGYPIEKEYPWRFTTTITLVLFTALTAFFVMLNIPLAAYDIGHEFTSDPNTTQTSPQTPFANFFPNMLRPSAGEFQPQILMPGDKVRTNLTLFEYEIIDAAALFTEWTHGPPVGSFEFRNQPLSNCDVGNVTVSVRKGERAHVDAEVLCWFPSYFRMRVQYDHGPTMLVNQRFVIHQSGTEMATFFRSQIDMALTDVENSWDRFNVTGLNNSVPANIVADFTSLSYFSCCDKCEMTDLFSLEDYVFENEPFYLRGHPGCDDSVPAKSSIKSGLVIMNNGSVDPLMLPWDMPSQMGRAWDNAAHLIYHALRFDLGVLAPNQIFNNPGNYKSTIYLNNTIFLANDTREPTFQPVFFVPVAGRFVESYASGYLFKELQDFVNNQLGEQRQKKMFLESPRVLMLSYVTPVFKPKPKLMALLNVFVAMFAMLSASWKVYHFVLGTIAHAMEDPRKANEACLHCGHKHEHDVTLLQTPSVYSSDKLSFTRDSDYVELPTMDYDQPHHSPTSSR